MFAHIIMTNFSCKKEKRINWSNHFKLHSSMIPHIILGGLSTALTVFFFKSKLKKSIYNDKENQYEKKTFSVKQRVYEFLFVSYSYSRKNIYNM